eukprot:5579393-Pyramimonas_sp.AAC.1
MASEALSLRSLRTLAPRVVCFIVQECPDGCCVNVRERLHAATQLPRNGLMIPDSCACHRLHNTVGDVTCEKQLAGDLHAIVRTSTSVANFHTLLTSWRKIAFSTRFRRVPGSPDPEVKKRSFELWRHARCRLASFARSQAESDEPNSTKAALEDIGERLVDLLNGDPRDETVITHWCSGCCSDDAEFRDKLYALGLESGVACLNQGTPVPAASRWGTCGTALGDVVALIVFNAIGIGVFEDAL